MSARRKSAFNPDLPIDIYGRISLDKDNDEEGVKRQVRQCTDHLKKMGLKVGNVFIDNDASAYTGVDRPGYEQMLERLGNGETGGIVAYHLKRLLRRMVEMERLITLVEGSGARVITLTSSELDLNTASGRAIGRVLAAFGQMEVEELSERLSGYFADQAAQGKPHHRGARPFGYKSDWLTPDPKEAKLVREVFDRVIDGWGVGQIAADWQQRGIVTRREARWRASSIRRLIYTHRYVGDSEHRGHVVGTGDWEPLVSKDTQRKAIAALQTRRVHLRSTSPSMRRKPRLLSGIIWCERCADTMVVNRNQGDFVYRCNKGCNTTIRADYAEEEVEKRFLIRLTDPKTLKALEKARRKAPDTHALTEEVEGYDFELEALANDYGAGEITRSEWLLASKGLKERKSAAVVRLERSSSDPALLSKSPQDILARWSRVDPDEKRRRLVAYVDKVRVLPFEQIESGRTGFGRKFWPERIAVDWRL